MIRSLMSASCTLGPDMRRKDLDCDLLRRMVAEWRRVSPCYLGDYYPLTPYSLEENAWMAMQFDLPDKGEGVVHAFRRSQCADETARFKLHGLTADAHYRLTDADTPGEKELTGRELMATGLPVTSTTRPAAAVIGYRRMP